MLCGIAKDLTKLGGKTITKLVTPDEQQSRLFRLVSFITGWKNSLKGAFHDGRNHLDGYSGCLGEEAAMAQSPKEVPYPKDAEKGNSCRGYCTSNTLQG